MIKILSQNLLICYKMLIIFFHIFYKVIVFNDTRDKSLHSNDSLSPSPFSFFTNKMQNRTLRGFVFNLYAATTVRRGNSVIGFLHFYREHHDTGVLFICGKSVKSAQKIPSLSYTWPWPIDGGYISRGQNSGFCREAAERQEWKILSVALTPRLLVF